MPTLNQLGESLLAQIYQSLTGGDATVPASPNTFVTWCTPGLPFEGPDLAFAAKGLGGGATAEQERDLLLQAFNFAQLVDFIPELTGVYKNDPGQFILRPTGSRMSHMYGQILNASKVVNTGVSETEAAKIEKFRNLLRTTKTIKNIVTDEEQQVTTDGPMLNAYNEKMAAYLAAALTYNTKRIAAQVATGPEGKAAVMDWANNAGLYRMQVKAAMDAWTSGGFRNEVDQINAFIDQVTRRDMKLWKQRLIEQFEGARLDALGSGQEFYYTTLMPGNLATSKGWTGMSYHSSSHSATSSFSKNAWGAKAGVSFGLFSFGGQGGGSSEKVNSNTNTSSFGLSMEITQAPISRPWFYPEFFASRGWTLPAGAGWTFEKPSDGGSPPAGCFVGFPTIAVFARNVTIHSAELAQAYEQQKSSFSAGGSVGWGPFSLGGSYSRSKGSSKFESSSNGQTITVPGTQLIAFVNKMVGKAPNPLPEIAPEDFS